MYTIAKAKEAIKDGIRGYLLKDEDGNYVMKEVNRLPFYMEGGPGIGKTEIVHQIAEELNIGYVSFSLTHHTRNSLLGLPVIRDLENGDKYTSYTMSEIIAKVLEQTEQGYQEGILLLDEFPCVSESILPAMLAFLQTKNIGTHRLPEGWVIVLCGNPPEYNKNARTFDAAIMDRIRKLEISFEPEVFIKYGEDTMMHPAVLDYLLVHEECVYRYKKEKQKQELVTCRGWENLSHMLNAYEKLGQHVDKDLIFQYLKSEEIAADFNQFYGQYQSGINGKAIEDILNGIRSERYVEKYQKADYAMKWYLVDHIVGYLEKKNEEVMDAFIMEPEIENILMELKELDEDSDENDCLWYNSINANDTIELLKRDRRFSSDNSLRKKVIDCWQCSDDVLFDLEEIEVGGKNLYEIAGIFLKKWYQQNKCENKYSEELGVISNQISRLFLFTKQIDQEKSLMEMLFKKINESDFLLNVLNCQPSEIYFNYCMERYAL